MDGIAGIVADRLSQNCRYTGTYFQFFMGMLHLVPWLISAAFAGIAAWTAELFWPILSAGGIINWVVNYLISIYAMSPAPLPECGGESALPALLAQTAFFYLTYIQMAKMIYKVDRIHKFHIFLLQEWATLAWASSIILGFNDMYQVVWGAIVGVATGFGFTVCVFLVVTTFYDEIMHIAEKFKYEDTIFAPYATLSLRADRMGQVHDAVIGLYEETPEADRNTPSYFTELMARLHYVVRSGNSE